MTRALGLRGRWPHRRVGAPIPEPFERQVARRPDHTAIKSGGLEISYRTLDRRTNRLAGAILAERGTGAEPVGLLLGSGISAIEAGLAVLKAQAEAVRPPEPA